MKILFFIVSLSGLVYLAISHFDFSVFQSNEPKASAFGQSKEASADQAITGSESISALREEVQQLRQSLEQTQSALASLTQNTSAKPSDMYSDSSELNVQQSSASSVNTEASRGTTLNHSPNAYEPLPQVQGVALSPKQAQDKDEHLAMQASLRDIANKRQLAALKAIRAGS